MSAPQKLTCGVPQGAVLSPMLFNIYMQPLGRIIRDFGMSCHQYADDTQLYCSLTPGSQDAVGSLCHCLEAVVEWMRSNGLKLNPDKTETLWVGCPSLRVLDHTVLLDGTALPLGDQVCSLGVLLDASLTLEAHVSRVVRSAYHQIRLIWQLRPYLESDALATVVHARVTSRLDYCNALYVGLPLSLIRRLQLVQNAAARVLSGTRCRDHITPVLRSLHWLPIIYRARFKISCLTYKAIHGSGPGYLRDRLPRYVPARPTRSAGRTLLCPVPLADCRGSRVRGRAFSVVAPALWNCLPPAIQEAPSLLVFRRLLKTFLFTQAFPE